MSLYKESITNSIMGFYTESNRLLKDDSLAREHTVNMLSEQAISFDPGALSILGIFKCHEEIAKEYRNTDSEREKQLLRIDLEKLTDAVSVLKERSDLLER